MHKDAAVSGRLVLADLRGLRAKLDEALDTLTEDMVIEVSPLPGWTRGHVLAHIVGVGAGTARQLEYVPAGRRVEFYDGGRPARNAAIETRAGLSAAEHARDVRATVQRVEDAMAALTPPDWDLPTGNKGRSVLQVAENWWRELGVHLTDLDLGPTPEVWSVALRDHLVAHLAPRVPGGLKLLLVPEDADPGSVRWVVGAGGEDVTVRGSAADLVAWLAGREPAGVLVAGRAGTIGDPPELLDLWP